MSGLGAVTQYNTELLIAGKMLTRKVRLAAGNYYRGMPVGYDAANDRYTYNADPTEIVGFYLGADETDVAENAWRPLIVWGEIYQGGIVDNVGDALTIDEDFIAGVGIRGFYIQRT